MDTSALVKSGHILIEALERHGVGVVAAMWVHNTDLNLWKLWIVPASTPSDPREFYRKVVDAIFSDEESLPNLDVSDVELVKPDHPAIKELRKSALVNGEGSAVHVTHSLFDGFYLPEGIVLKMETVESARA